jgi:hypothetical protein
MSEPVPGIFKKMAKVMEKISRVPKNGKNKFFNYDYVTEADLTDHIRPILAEEGIAFTSTVLEATKTPVEKEGSKENKEGAISTVKMLFRLIDADDGSSIESVFLGEGSDKGDKGFYKAYTGCTKYFLMKTFLVATGDDPEDDGAPKEKGKPYPLKDSKGKPAETPKQEPKKDKPDDPMLEELPEKKRLDIIKSTDTLFEQLAHEAETNIDEIKVELLQEFFGVESRKQLRYSQCRELYTKLKNRLIEVQNAV